MSYFGWPPSTFTVTPMGWECPKCGRVYAPTIMMCFSCPQPVVTVTEPFWKITYGPATSNTVANMNEPEKKDE